MALPPYTKSWNHSWNNHVAGSNVLNTFAQNLMFGIKNLLVTMGWVVDYSSNSTTAGTAGDGIDRWVAPANLVWSSGTPSWIVLKNTTTGWYMLIVCSSSNSAYIQWAFKSSAYSGGTTSTPPGSSNLTVLNTDFWNPHVTTSTMRAMLHGWYSTDARCQRILICMGGHCVGELGMEFRPQEQNNTQPFVAYWYGGHVSNGAAQVLGPCGDYSNTNGAKFGGIRTASSGTMLLMANRGGFGVATKLVYAANNTHITPAGPYQDNRHVFFDVIYDSNSPAVVSKASDYYVTHFLSRGGQPGMFFDDGVRKYAAFDGRLLPWDGTKVRYI